MLALLGLGCSHSRDSEHKSSTSTSAITARATVVPLSFAGVNVEHDAGAARFDGLPLMGKPGQPELPIRVVRVLVAPDADLSQLTVTLEGAEETLVPGTYQVTPAKPTKTGAAWPEGANIVDGKDMAVYGQDSAFPATNVVSTTAGQLHRYKTVEVAVSPYRWNPVTGEMRMITGGRLVVSAPSASDASAIPSGSAAFEGRYLERLSALVDNFAEGVAAYQPARAGDSEIGVAESALTAGATGYAIVTTSQIKNSSQYLGAFADSKMAHGLTVKLVLENDSCTRSGAAWSCGAGGGWNAGSATGNAAAESLRSWVRANYVSNNLAYVLLIGNPDPFTGSVPMKMTRPQQQEELPTDFYFAEVSGNWDLNGDLVFGDETGDQGPGGYDQFAEVSVGRIPYYNVIADLDHILAKSIAYGNTPASANAWRKNALIAIKPIEGLTPNWGLGEWMRSQYLSPNGWTTTRVYDQSYGVSPEYTPCTFDTVSTAWKAAPRGLVFWNTHGGTNIAEEIITSDGATKIDDLHPSFTVQLSCDTGTPEASNNLAYALLKNGAIGTLAATRQESSGMVPTSLMNTGEPLVSSYIQSLATKNMSSGDALSAAHSYARNAWLNSIVFNLYGDPSLGIGSNGTTALEVPRAPTLPTPSAADGSVTLTWAALPAASAYSVYRATSSTGTYTKVATTTSVTGYKDTGVSNGTTYYYKITGVSPGGEGTFSNVVSANPSAPVAVQYRFADTSGTDNLIRPYLKVTNTGTTSLPLSGVKLRYWFTDENPATTTASCESGGMACSVITPRIVRVSPSQQKADSYVEVSFSSAAPTLAAGQTSSEIRIQIRHTAAVNFTESNDFSYDVARTSFANFRRVTAYQSSGALIWGDAPIDYPYPTAPHFVYATAGNASVNLTWPVGSGAASYNVYRWTDSTGRVKVASNRTVTNYLDQGLVNDMTYYYDVTSVSLSGVESWYSLYSSVTPSASAPTAAPIAPTNLTVTPHDGWVTLSWDAVSGVTGYNIRRSTSANGTFVLFANVIGNSPMIDVMGLDSGATYYLKVAAFNAVGEGDSSSVVAYQSAPATLPAQVTGLVPTPGDRQVTLAWAPVTGATGYAIARSVSGGAFQPLTTTPDTSYTDPNLSNGTTYSYRVAATNAAGQGPDSSTVSATPQPGVGEPCSPAQDVTGTQSGNFNTTGPVCLRTTANISGWGCSNFDGRTVKVNGVPVNCGVTPLPAKFNGTYYYFDVSAGSFPWASIYWW